MRPAIWIKNTSDDIYINDREDVEDEDDSIYFNGKRFTHAEFEEAIRALPNMSAGNTPQTATELPLIPAHSFENAQDGVEILKDEGNTDSKDIPLIEDFKNKYSTNIYSYKFDENENLWIYAGAYLGLGSGLGESITIVNTKTKTEEYYEWTGFSSPSGGHSDVYVILINGIKKESNGKNGEGGGDVGNKVRSIIEMYKNMKETSDNTEITLEDNPVKYEYKSGDVITEVISIIYDLASPFSDGLASVSLNGKWGYIDKAGKEIAPFIYDFFSNDFSEGLAEVCSNNKWGYIDKTGKEVIPLKYDSVRLFSDGLAAVRLNGKCGYIDKAGKEIAPFIYDAAYSFSEGLAAVRLNGKWGYIDKAGKEIAPFIYDSDRDFSEGLAAVCLNGNWGYIDKTGKEIVPFIYDYAYNFSEGLAAVLSNNKWGYISYLPEYSASNYKKVTSVSDNDTFGIISGLQSRESELRSDNHFYLDNNMQKSTWVYYLTYYYHVDEKGNIEKNKWIERRYVGEDGKMYRGRQTPDGKWVGNDGLVVNVDQDLTDSLIVEAAEPDSWYKTQSGLWYYFENDRTTTKKGWFIYNRDNQTYYLDPSTGIMAVGWTKIDGDMYYFNEFHNNENNWYEIGDGFYESYGKKVKAYGSMFRDEETPDGKKVDKEGKLIK